jgi:hypothetical protein
MNLADQIADIVDSFSNEEIEHDHKSHLKEMLCRLLANHTCEICDAEIAEDDLDTAAWSAFAQKGNHP